MFFAGTLNSPTRRALHAQYSFGEGAMNTLNRTDVLVTTRIRKDAEYRMNMWRSKFCLIACGSSHTNSVRLYDVIMHGCIPVIISTDFMPPLSDLLDWTSFSVFIDPNNVTEVESILRSIKKDERNRMFNNLVTKDNAAAKVLSFYDKKYWTFMMRAIASAVSRGISDHPLSIVKQNIPKPSFIKELMIAVKAEDDSDLASLKFTTPFFGCTQSGVLLSALAAVTRRRTAARLVVDIGAGVGLFTQQVFNVFSNRNIRNSLDTFGDISCTEC
ncbi:hypothetical protein C9890_0516, partial [Perkinsus sp. BL_2016]